MTDSSSPALRFGLFMPQIGCSATEMIAAARNAEKAGFDSLWIMDHLYAPGAPQFDTLESWTLLSAIAASTSSIRLGHLVGCNPFRHPSLLAKMAATVDQLSGGRLDLGLGWGSVEEEFGIFGFEVGTRRERAEQLGETIEILRKMFTGEPFDYTGTHFRLSGAYGRPTPVRGTIPIHIGGAGKQLTMPLVAEHAQWWNCVASARSRFDELAPLRGAARISVQYPVGVVVDESSRSKVAERTARRMPESGWGEPLIGTLDELAEKFESEAERGVELAIVRFHDRADPDTLDRFGREVIAPLSGG
ncbi:LLM class flavin-dependent oxidoreductase [Gordonia hydrophobica]|uniref:LLM class flavin-dependent oxidoreductase n=1 Tax=Gordonia hydrophobica TaxID=40516 RepID=A0ABZ2TZE1_9ACTN|nr:LLM class flavin-dependent oxidoreductase [Gordonia hydrophobica]MBM7368859.1 alkanesulfonate monooxygenase SsuD/methylene tetrahydromethanopterin reductase-like flavin-dependent oxidoreductase (luciferase family) [Gordonia hydrophobica]